VASERYAKVVELQNTIKIMKEENGSEEDRSTILKALDNL